MTKDLHHLAGAYALDALDDVERQEFEQHLAHCEVCRDDVAEFSSVTDELAEFVSTAPPAGLKAKIMAEVSETRQIPPQVPDRVVDLAERRRRKTAAPKVLAAVAAAVVLIAGVIGATKLFGSSSDPATELLAAPDAVVTELVGDDGTIEVVWSPSQDRAVVVATDIDDAGEGKDYELWFLLADGTAPAGLFNSSDGEVEQELDMSALADDEGIGWGVTIEPEGGSPAPTSDVIYSATF